MPPPSQSMTPRGQLDHFRANRTKFNTAEEAIPWLTRTLFTEAGWWVYLDNRDILCARDEKRGMEIRVSRKNGTIGGAVTENYDKHSKGFIHDAQEAMRRLLFEGEVTRTMVKVSTTREVDWYTIISRI